MAPISRRLFVFGGAALFPYLYLERLAVCIKRYRIAIPGLPADFEGFTILHLTDLHDKAFGRNSSELLALLDTERFDLVALTGDMVVGDAPVPTQVLHLIEELKQHQVLSVSGNHEWKLGQGEKLQEKLREAGAHVLCNSGITLHRGSSRLAVIGVDDPVTGRAHLGRAVASVQVRGPRLLLAHSPQICAEAVKEKIDLVLTGHTHGGQFRLPLLGAPYVPGMGMFPPYDYGVYQVGSTTMVVNAGLGESLLPVRFNIRPEIVLVTLVAGSAPPRPLDLPPWAGEGVPAGNAFR